MARKPRIRPTPQSEAAGKATDSGARGVGKVLEAAGADPNEVPGPSTNPATNLLIHDLAMRMGGRLLRHTMEKGLLRGRYGGTGAKAIVENRSLGQALITSLVARVATRSLPGAMLVSGGLVAKTLYDRGRSKRAARRSGDAAMRNMAKE